MEQLKIEMEYEEKEMKRKREEEARKAEEALEKRVVEWDDEVLTPDVLHELTTTWEVRMLAVNFLFTFPLTTHST